MKFKRHFQSVSNKLGWWARGWWRIRFGRYFLSKWLQCYEPSKTNLNLLSYMTIIAQVPLLSFQIVKMKSLDGARRRKMNVTELEFKWSVHQHVMFVVKMFGPIQNARIERRHVKIEMSWEIVEKPANVLNHLIIKSR